MRRVLEWALSDGVSAARRLTSGVPAGYLEELVVELGLSGEELREVFGMSRATWSRRRRRGTLSLREGELVYRVARLYGMALMAFGGDGEKAREWMRRPHPELNRERPLLSARLEPTAREAEAVLIRALAGVPV